MRREPKSHSPLTSSARSSRARCDGRYELFPSASSASEPASPALPPFHVSSGVARCSRTRPLQSPQPGKIDKMYCMHTLCLPQRLISFGDHAQCGAVARRRSSVLVGSGPDPDDGEEPAGRSATDQTASHRIAASSPGKHSHHSSENTGCGSLLLRSPSAAPAPAAAAPRGSVAAAAAATDLPFARASPTICAPPLSTAPAARGAPPRPPPFCPAP